MEIPQSLQEKIRAGKVISFAGAGVSMAVLNKNTDKPLFPSWKQLLLQAADKLEKEKKAPYAQIVRGLLEINPPDYLESATRARAGLGSLWYELLKENLDPPHDLATVESLALARAVWGLASNLIITTNYDRVLQWACPDPKNLTCWDIEAKVEQAEFLSKGISSPVLWNLHGQIGNKANLILTSQAYHELYPEEGEAEKRYHAALNTLRSLLVSHSLLFIGFSLDDEYFGLELKAIHQIFEGAATHYVLVRKREEERVRALELPVEIVTFSDHGGPQLGLLEALSACKGPAAVSTAIRIAVAPILVTSNAPSYDPKNNVFFVPFRSKGDQVIGQEEVLQAVRKQLTTGLRTNIGQTASFEGLGGLGKTQLAVEYAYRFRNDYPNGVIWLTADQDIDAQLIALCTQAGWIAPESEHKYKLEVAKQRLRTYSDCLIVFDNLEDLSTIEPYLPLPSAQPHILATSRFEQPGFTRVPISPLDKALSLRLLFQNAGRNPQGEAELFAASRIAEALDGLPLALELAGAYLQHRGVSYQEYYELLSKNLKVALPPRFLTASFTKHDKDLYSTLKINEGVFSEEPKLRDVLDLLTWSGSAPMGKSLLCSLLKVKELTEIGPALSLGKSLQLLQQSPVTESYSIQRLVREVRREDIPLEDRINWTQDTCKALGDWFQERREHYSDLPQFEAAVDHLRAWQENSLRYVPGQSSRLIWLEAYPPYHRGLYTKSQSCVKRALAVFESTKSTDEGLKANLLNDLGSCLLSLGSAKEALDYAGKALSLRERLFGENHPDTATSLGNVGTILNALGDHKRALEHAEKALVLRKALSGKKPRETAISLNNVGMILRELGDYKRALDYAEEALALHRERVGEKHPDTAQSLGNVGSILGNLGDHKRSLDCAQKALALHIELFGEKHPDAVTALANAGAALFGVGDHKRALEYEEKALALNIELFGERHPDTAGSLHNLGMTLDGLGEHKRALDCIEKALALRKELLGERHPDTASSVSNAGMILVELGDHKRGLEYSERALAIRRELFGEKHPDTARSLRNVGKVYSGVGDNKKALEFQKQALESWTSLRGETDEATASAAFQVIQTLIALNRRYEAYRLADEFLGKLPKGHSYIPRFEAMERTLLSKQLRPGFRNPLPKRRA
jgi:tetratricopeptide (TPR) repeat protein